MLNRESIAPDTTLDSIWSRDVRILQPRKGYRFALDSVLLASFLCPEADDTCLEIGAGSGVVSILLSRRHKFGRLTAVEVQPDLADLCRRNFESNGLSHAEALEGDINLLASSLTSNSFDLIFSNPPYRRLGAGKLNPLAQKAIARHEIKLKLKDLFDCAAGLLAPAGRLSVILPAFREQDFSRLVTVYKMHWSERRYVHSFADTPPAFVLATVSNMPVPFKEYPPLILYDAPGCYTSETRTLLNL